MLGVRLEPELEQRLAALAKKTGDQKATLPRKLCVIISSD